MTATRRSNDLWVCHLGTVEYNAAVALQEHVRERRQADEIPDVLLLLDHPPVYTRGRRSREDELPMGEQWCRERGIDVVATDRGGRLTYHGPGQLVGYPIMLIDDVIEYLRTMEQAIIATLSGVGVTALTRPRLTGVWVQERKVASIGVHVSRGVTTHGFAINVENDVEPFSWVVACGLPDVTMTSASLELGRPVALADLRVPAATAFAHAYGRNPREVSAAELGWNGPARDAAAAPVDARRRPDAVIADRAPRDLQAAVPA